MRIGTRIVAPFVLSSLAALLGFACTAQVDESTNEAPAADEATPPKPPSEAPGEHGSVVGGGEHAAPLTQLEHCQASCELHYRDCKDHVAHRWPRALVECDRVHDQCLDRCTHDAEHEGEHGH